MRIAQLLAGRLASGAGRGVEVFHKGLLARGIDSRLIGRLEKGLDPKLQATRLPIGDRLVTNLMFRAQSHLNRMRFGDDCRLEFMQLGSNFNSVIPYRTADIVHVQWASAISMGTRFWRSLADENRPIVWTLRDMWPFTGGCHVSEDCVRLEVGCGNCPQLGSVSERRTAREAAFKRASLPRNITFIAISDHFACKARNSLVLRDHDIRVIHNSTGIEFFAEPSNDNPRAFLKLPNDRLILSTGALNLSLPRKGAHLLAKLLKRYSSSAGIRWGIFGGGFERLMPVVPPYCTSFGLVTDLELLRNIYRASDLFIMPSLQESFGKVTVEAMAAGTPVIAYRDTPAEEIIVDGKNGWLVPFGDEEAFVATVDKAIALGHARLALMGEAARTHVATKFSLANVIDRHLSLYEEKLTAHRRVHG